MEQRQWNLLGVSILILFLMLIPASAMVEPNPVIVIATAYDKPVPNMKVIITNTRTDERVIGYTDTNGEFLYDWANSEYKYMIDDTFNIQLEDMNRQVTYIGRLMNLNKFDLSGKCIIPNCPPCDICPVCEVCEVCPTCIVPVEEKTSFLDLIGQIFISLVVGTGIGLSIYKDKNGKIKFSIKSHRHAGRNYLHSVYRVHRPPYEHGYGEPIPVYKDDVYIPNKEYPKK